MADEDRFKALCDFANWPIDRQETFVSWLERSNPVPGLSELGFNAYRSLELWTAEPFVNVQQLLENLSEVASAAQTTPQSTILRIVSEEICKVPEQDRNRFSQILERAIRCHRLFQLSIKAGSILWRQGRVFAGASSITQVRPIFEGDKELAIAGGAIVHELQFEYFENGVKQSATLLFDHYRLEVLKDAIARAQHKEKIIRGSGTPTKIF